MKIINKYDDFVEGLDRGVPIDVLIKSNGYHDDIIERMKTFGLDFGKIKPWMQSSSYESRKELVRKFKVSAIKILERVQTLFSCEFKGEIWICASLMHIDGFARFDHGSHVVYLGADHPEATENYLTALLAHELSHVYRDHQPNVWKFLGMPLEQISRQKYMEHYLKEEHLISEGLATLFSQFAFPEIPVDVHHFYSGNELAWFNGKHELVENKISEFLHGDYDWSCFYRDDYIANGSPSRAQYYWAAQEIKKMLMAQTPNDFKNGLILAHKTYAPDFDFIAKLKSKPK